MTIEKFFDHIGKLITSIALVILILLIIICFMIFFSHKLFFDTFPVDMGIRKREIASWLMAIAWDTTVLITTVNSKFLKKYVPKLMAIYSGIIVLFFIHAFDFSQDPLTIVQRWFVGLLAATIVYIYTDLFYTKWTERTKQVEQPAKVDELQTQLHERDAAVQQLTATLHETHSALVDARAEWQKIAPELKQLRAFKEQITKERTCPHCNTEFNSHDGLRSHKGRCTSKQAA